MRTPTDSQRFACALAARPNAKAQAARFGALIKGVEWSQAYTPTLKDLTPVASLVPEEVRRQITEPPAQLTEFEKAGGKPMVFILKDGRREKLFPGSHRPHSPDPGF